MYLYESVEQNPGIEPGSLDWQSRATTNIPILRLAVKEGFELSNPLLDQTAFETV